MMRFLLFGVGRAGAVHARNIARHTGAELAWVVDIDQAAAQRVADQHGGRAAATAAEAWAADDFDAVMIASSTDTHVEFLRQALCAGKPTYCEKPIDHDIDRARAVTAEAARSGVPVLIGFRRRFLADYQNVRRSIADGAVGPIETILVVARDHTPPSVDYVRVSGGLLRDKMIHYFDLVCWLTGERPVEAYAAGACLVDPAIGQAGDVDTAVVVLRFPSGALCTIENGRRSSYGAEDRIEVFGARGLIRTQTPPGSHVLRLTAAGVERDRHPDNVGYESFAGALDEFISAVEEGRPMAPSLQDGLQAQLIAEAAAASMQEGRPVTITYGV